MTKDEKEELLKLIDTAEYQAVFSILNNVAIDQKTLTALKQEYKSGLANSILDNRLRALVHTIQTIELPDEQSLSYTKTVKPPKPKSNDEGNVALIFIVFIGGFALMIYLFIHFFAGHHWQDLEPFKEKGKYGFRHKTTLVTVIAPTYTDAKKFSEEVAPVAKQAQYGFIDKDNAVIIDFQYEDAEPFGTNGLALVKKNGKFGVIDKTNKVVIAFRYDWILPFTEALAGVSVNDRCGFINERGATVIPLIYDLVFAFEKGTAEVKLEDKYFRINTAGECIDTKVSDDFLAKHGIKRAKP